MKWHLIYKASAIALFFSFISCTTVKEPKDISPNKVIPSATSIAYQEMEMVGFIHFSINTFTDKEWGYGDESPALFNPTDLDVNQWAEVAKASGLKELILTAKHHDGFCLWPSKYTDHSIKNSPYKNGQGDIVKEFVEACRRHGLKAGLYLSPWDRHHADYGSEAYITYYKQQLQELLTQYGEINEIWFDGANGGDGYYGGASEMRRIDAKTYYPWKEIVSLAKTWQPDIQIFSDAGPDIHWIGNEKGFAGFTFWSTITADSIVIGDINTQSYLNKGNPKGANWIVGQCDVSIRPGWFYHKSQDSLVKNAEQLTDIYYKSVGRNAVLLLNLPPDRRGQIHENDIAALSQFKHIIDKTFAQDLTKNAEATASNVRQNHTKFAAKNVLNNKKNSYWATDDSLKSADITVECAKPIVFDRVLLQEPIRFGQRISRFEVDVWETGQWKTVFEGTTIGYKRLLRIPVQHTDKIRLRILEANNTIAISKIALFKADEGEGYSANTASSPSR